MKEQSTRTFATCVEKSNRMMANRNTLSLFMAWVINSPVIKNGKTNDKIDKEYSLTIARHCSAGFLQSWSR